MILYVLDSTMGTMGTMYCFIILWKVPQGTKVGNQRYNVLVYFNFLLVSLGGKYDSGTTLQSVISTRLVLQVPVVILVTLI